MNFPSYLSINSHLYFTRSNGGCFLSSKLILLALILFSTLLCACGNDTQALRNTLSSLCKINTENEFGSCCKTHNTTFVDIKDKKTWDCFLRDIGSDANLNVTSLFVFFLFFSFLFFLLFIFTFFFCCEGILNLSDLLYLLMMFFQV